MWIKKFSLIIIIMLLSFFIISQAFAWTITAGFESGTVGLTAQGTSGFSWAGSRVLFSNEEAKSGSQSAKVSWQSGSTGFGPEHAEYNYPSNIIEDGEVWARGYYFFKSTWSWTCSPVVKILRVHQKPISSTVGSFISVFADTNGKIVLSNEASEYQPTSSTYFDTDRWQSIEIYVKFSSIQGIVRIWKNGVLVLEDLTRKTMSAANYDSGYILANGYWNGGVPQNQIEYLDDFMVTNVQPSNSDASGNYMIGPTGWPLPSPPSSLTIQ